MDCCLVPSTLTVVGGVDLSSVGLEELVELENCAVVIPLPTAVSDLLTTNADELPPVRKK